MKENPLTYKPEPLNVRPRDEYGLEWRPTNPSDLDEQVIKEQDGGPTYWPLRLLAGVAVLILGGRLLQLQVVSGQQYRQLAEGNSVRTVRLRAERGIVFDQKGSILTRNTKQATATVNLERFPKDRAEQEKFWQRVEKIIPVNQAAKEEIGRLRQQNAAGEYQIASAPAKEQYLLLKELSGEENALTLSDRIVRRYETGAGLAHLLGYVGQVTEKELASGEYGRIDVVGKNGVERSYESELRGQAGVQMVEVDAQGRPLGNLSDDRNKPPVPGASLRLAIDWEIQKQVAEALRQAMEARDKQFPEAASLGGTVIVMDPRNGQLKSLVSLPDYDNNLFAKGIKQSDLDALTHDQRKPLISRANFGLYPPGSTIKPLVAAGALHHQVVSPYYSLDTPPAINIGNFSFPDWKDHGQTDIKTAIAESNNIFFYMLGGGWQSVDGLGLERLRETVHWFGYERKTGIDLPGEETGYFLSAERKRKLSREPVYLGDIYHVSIGQGDIGVTPLQVTVATAAIANGGTVYEPRLVESFVDANNQNPRPVEPTVAAKLPVSGQSLGFVQAGMRQAVTDGSSRTLAALSVPLAGKTGTAQFGTNKLTHAWFTGYGPYNNPEYVVTVLLEGGGGSFEAAVPLAETVFRIIFNEPKPVP